MNSTLRTCLVGLAGATLALAAAAQTSLPAGDVEMLLQQYSSLKAPELDSSRNDQDYLQTYRKEKEAFETKRDELARRIYLAGPHHPAAMAMMRDRWIRWIQAGKADAVISETQAALAGQPTLSERADILYVQARARLAAEQKASPKAAEGIEEFLKADPADERGGELLYRLAGAQTDTEKQVVTYQRIIQLYPGLSIAQTAQGAIRRAQSLGKPFELAFSDAISGRPIDLQRDMKGKVVVIEFWASWCSDCIAEMPRIKGLYSQYKDNGVEFIGVSLDQPEDKGGLKSLKEYVAKNGITWPQYYQGNYFQSGFSSDWGINAIPWAFVVDKQGKLHSAKALAELETIIPELLKSSTIATSPGG